MTQAVPEPPDQELEETAEEAEERPNVASRRASLSGVPPYPVPPGVTHFVLRPGLSGAQCTWVDDVGVSQYKHPIEDFTIPTILERWGPRQDYYVMFFEQTPEGRWQTRGPLHLFGLTDRNKAEPKNSTQALARPLSGGIGEALALAASLKSLAAEDTRLQVESIREGHKAQNELLMHVFGMFAGNQQNQALFGQIGSALQNLAQEINTMKQQIASFDEEDPDDDELKRREKADVIRAFRKEGAFAALGELLAQQAPDLVPKIPGILSALQQKLQAPAQSAVPAGPPVGPASPGVAIR